MLMWNIKGQKPNYNKVFKQIKRRLNWETSWHEADLLYQQLSKDKSFKKELLRKAIHLSSLWIPAAIYFMPKIVLIPILMIIIIMLDILDLILWQHLIQEWLLLTILITLIEINL